ncbi:MAG: hypothetical protein AABY93_04575 [Bacteroidota bacterium]
MSFFIFSCLRKRVLIIYSVIVRGTRGIGGNVGGIASKGLRAMSYQGTRNVEAGYEPTHTTETLIGYTACCALVAIILQLSPIISKLDYRFPVKSML